MKSNVLELSEEFLLKRKKNAEKELRRKAKMSPEEKDNLKVMHKEWRQKVKNTKIGCKSNFSYQSPLIGSSRYCLEHWLDRTYVRKTNRFNATVEELKALWDKQSGRCSITNAILVPGKNVSLDHIIPADKKGTNTIENLRFIHYNINLLKHNMSDIELKSILNEIGPSLLEWAKEK